MRSSWSAERKLSQSGDIPRSTKMRDRGRPQKRQEGAGAREAGEAPPPAEATAADSVARLTARSAAPGSSTAPGSRSGDCGAPAQRLVEAPGCEQAADLIDPPVAWPLEFLELQIAPAIRLVELPGAFSGGPARLEGREGAGDLGEVDTIGARVGAGPFCELEAAAGHGVGHDPGEVADLEVLLRPADVEDLVVHELAGRL